MEKRRPELEETASIPVDRGKATRNKCGIEIERGVDADAEQREGVPFQLAGRGWTNRWTRREGHVAERGGGQGHVEKAEDERETPPPTAGGGSFRRWWMDGRGSSSEPS